MTTNWGPGKKFLCTGMIRPTVRITCSKYGTASSNELEGCSTKKNDPLTTRSRMSRHTRAVSLGSQGSSCKVEMKTAKVIEPSFLLANLT